MSRRAGYYVTRAAVRAVVLPAAVMVAILAPHAVAAVAAGAVGVAL